MTAIVIFIGIIIGFVVAINVDYHRKIRNGEWNFYNGRYMRRRIGGEWQYRPTTESEVLDWMDMHAW